MIETFIKLFSKVNLNTSVYDDLKTGHDLLVWLQSHDESLYEHLMECARLASIYATNHIEAWRSWGFSTIWKFFLAGFLHDIGKPGCGCTISRGKHLCMKGHGPVGSAIIENITSQNLLNTFNLTRADMADIAAAVNYHMCGYHAHFPINKGSLNIDAFSLLTPSVKDLICALRVSDSLAIQGPHGQEEKDLVVSTQKFRKAISKPVSQYAFMTSHGTTKGVLIMIQGSSGQGKTTLSHKIRKHLLDKGVGVSYVECNKKWAREINAKVRKEIEYELLQVRKEIEYELLRGNVVILDTLATMYMQHCDLIPEIAQHALRVAIWVHRPTEAMNQLEESRPQDFTNPIGKGLEWGNLVSITEDESQDKDAYKRPHFTMTTGWSGLMDSQFEHLMGIVSGNYGAQAQSIPRPPSIDDTIDMSLLDLMRHLYARGKLMLLKEFFEYNHCNIKVEEFKDTVEEFKDTVLKYIIMIKYIDGINQLWKPRWARETRERGYAINWECDVYEIKSSLNRGAYMHQQTIVKMFNTKDNVPIEDAYITQKVDDSLLVVTYYPVDTSEHDLMSRYVDLTGCYHVKTILGLYIPSTSGNVCMSDAMKCYFVTAATAFCGVEITRSSSDAVWEDIKDSFTQKIDLIIDEFGYNQQCNQQCSLVFEMVCQDRVTHDKKVHTEHPSSGLFFLGTCRATGPWV